MEATESMLHDQDLPMHLWVEITRTIVYVQNCTPHRVLENKTPEEDFSREKPDASNLREYLASQCTYISQRRKGPSSILLGGRVSLWDIVIHPMPIEYTSQNSRRSTSLEMKPLMKTRHTSDLGGHLFKRSRNLKKYGN